MALKPKIKNLKPKKKEDKKNKPKKMTGILFYMVTMIVLVDDVLFDLSSNGTLILSVMSFLSAIFTGWILIMYFWLEKVSIKGKRGRQKIATWVAAAIIETIPFINVLPMGVVTLFVTRFLENSPFIDSVVNKL